MAERTLGEEAQHLARIGWRIFPTHGFENGRCTCRQSCGSPAKHPRVRRWQEVATTDAATVAEWWHRWPNANVALATGRDSGVVALDVDPDAGGDDALHELEQSYEALPATVTALSGGGGTHYLFKSPTAPVRTTAGRIGTGLDVRGEGGYVVLPPSLHHSGRRYAWDGDPDDLEPAELPPWLEAVCGHAATQKRDTSAPITGERNVALTSLAGTLVRAGLTPDAVRLGLHAHNQARCQPPLSIAEVDRIADSAAKFSGPPPWITNLAAFLADDRLDPRDRLLLVAIVAHANARGVAWPSYTRLREITGLSKGSVTVAIRSLENAGRIHVERKRRTVNRYTLT